MSNQYREQTDAVPDPAGARTGITARRRRTARRVGLGTGLSAVTAAFVTAAAADCDSEALVALATDSGTELMFGTETPEQTFALPDTDTQHYRTLVALLGGTRGAVSGGDPDNRTVVWPRVATPEFR